eukprot:4280418-Amphidinium_carterae.2
MMHHAQQRIRNALKEASMLAGLCIELVRAEATAKTNNDASHTYATPRQKQCHGKEIAKGGGSY